MLGRTDLEAYTSWDFPSQATGHADAGDASFNGVTPAGCAANLVRRYSGPGDLVVDPMSGSGTIGDVAGPSVVGRSRSISSLGGVTSCARMPVRGLSRRRPPPSR
jgi:hypothetical protein